MLTAAQLNTQLRDNMIELRAGGVAVTSQAANDLIYATSASQFGRIAAVAAGQVLVSGTTPAYSATPSVTSIAVSGSAAATPTAGAVYRDTIVNAWANVANAGTPSITADVNVASLTDNGTGDTTVTFATAMSNANYAAVASPRAANARRHASCYTFATGSVRVYTYSDAANSAEDADFSLVVVGG